VLLQVFFATIGWGMKIFDARMAKSGRSKVIEQTMKSNKAAVF